MFQFDKESPKNPYTLLEQPRIKRVKSELKICAIASTRTMSMINSEKIASTSEIYSGTRTVFTPIPMPTRNLPKSISSNESACALYDCFIICKRMELHTTLVNRNTVTVRLNTSEEPQ